MSELNPSDGISPRARAASAAQAAVIYAALLLFVVATSAGAAWIAPELLPNIPLLVGKETTQVLAGVVAFILLHLLLELFLSAKESMKDLWPFRQVSRLRNWLWSLVAAGFVVGIATNLVSHRIQQTLDRQVSSAASDISPSSTPENAKEETAPRSRPPVAVREDSPSPSATLATGSSPGPIPASSTPLSAENAFTVVLIIPSRFRDLQVLADAEPARIVDRQLSLIKVLVPRRAEPIHFKLQSNQLSKPREFTLTVDRDNLEYSPFQ
jgi:hypothetical protein